MDPISAAVAAAPWFIEWIKERRLRGVDIDTDAFRKWLSEVAFPQLLDGSRATVELLFISQKAYHAELRGCLGSQFDDIRATLEKIAFSGSDAAGPWTAGGSLGTAAQALLCQLRDQVGETDGTYEDAQLTGPFAVPDATDAEVHAGRRRAAEGGLILCTDASSNGQWLRLPACGYLTTIAATAGQEQFDASLELMCGALGAGADRAHR